MAVIVDQVQTLLERRFQEANLSQFVKWDYSQFLDLSWGGRELFVEVVLTDGSALDEAEKLVRQTAEELAHQGIELDSVVRALWEIESIEYSGRSKTPELRQYRAAAEFRVVLRSGSRHHQVLVHVFSGAIDILRHKLGLNDSVASLERELPDGHLLTRW